MSCEKAIALVEKLADGEASVAEKRAAEAHLESCASCRAHLDFLESVAKTAGSSAPPQPPDSYWEHLPRKILRRIEEERERSRPRSLWRRLLPPAALRWGALGATLVVLAAVGVSVFRDDPGLVVEEAPPAMATPPAAEEPPEPAATPSEPGPVLLQQRAASDPEPEDAPAPAPAPPMARDEAATETPSAPPGLEFVPEDQVTAGADEPARALGYLASVAVAEKPAESVVPAATSPSERAGAEESTAAAGVAGEVPGRSFSKTESEREAEENDYRLLKQGDPALEGRRARAEDASLARFANADAACEGWRRFLTTHGDEGPRGADARYELARCSLLRFERDPSDDLRDAAVADARAFLSREAEGPRAEEIKKALSRAQRSP